MKLLAFFFLFIFGNNGSAAFPPNPYACIDQAQVFALHHHHDTWGNPEFQPDIKETVEIKKYRSLSETNQVQENFSFIITQSERRGFVWVRYIHIEYHLVPNKLNSETNSDCLMYKMTDYGLIESHLKIYRPKGLPGWKK